MESIQHNSPYVVGHKYLVVAVIIATAIIRVITSGVESKHRIKLLFILQNTQLNSRKVKTFI